MTIGERIKEKRLEKKMSLDNLAKVAHVARQTIYKYENNLITNIPTDKIESISKALSVSPGYLMGWETDENKTIFFSNKLGDKVRELRGNRRKEEFAKSCGISLFDLDEIETGEDEINAPITCTDDVLEILRKISDHTEINYSDLKDLLISDISGNCYFLPNNKFHELLTFLINHREEAEPLNNYLLLSNENKKIINDMIDLFLQRQMNNEKNE